MGLSSSARRKMMLLIVGLLPLVLTPARAADQKSETYPLKPIRLVVGFPVGGSADAQARLLASKLATALGQPVLVDNKAGAGGNIGAEIVAKAAPDGYTLLLAALSSLAINPWLYERLPFDPARDFAYVGQVAAFQGVVVVAPSQPFTSLKELAAYARTHAGQLSYGSPGNGTAPQLSSKLFERAASIEMQHVPYRGDAAALTDTVSGQVPLSFVNLAPALGLIRAGKLRALAVTGRTRSTLLPGVPTIEEVGFVHSAVPSWSGLVVPAGTPPAIVERLSRALGAVSRDPEYRDKMTQQSAEVTFTTGSAFATLAANDRARLGRVIRDAHITLD